ncbi:MAG: helix-turn-helix domain-containing protein, partial [Nocardioidaceae bacterium]|nr:helix-turn-helix domain-containing protein [Nocardioidaceae bacterium]
MTMTEASSETGTQTTASGPAESHQDLNLRVDVRRHVGLAAAVGGLATVLAVAFAVRAFSGGSGLDWLALAVLGMVAIAHIASLVDSRAPLLVADAQGVRVRNGNAWRGIAWPEIDCLEHLPRRGLVKDGHLLVDGYDDQQLLVPLTLATRVVGARDRDLSDVLAELSGGRAEVVEVVPGLAEEPRPEESGPEESGPEESGPEEFGVEPHAARDVAHEVGREATTGLGSVGFRNAPLRTADAESWGDEGQAYEHRDDEDRADEDRIDPDEANTDEIEAVVDTVDPAPEPVRAMALPARVEIESDERATEEQPSVAPQFPAETGTVVLTDLAVQPAAHPIVGPRLVDARERLRLSIDQLSERTRIRPHVIEAIEVDDFGPCGGDFYARGHLRTLARVLGIDAGPLVVSYDDNYAHEPVDARRVFESELATGAGGAIRSTRGGRNWSVL